jgi:hypothetical protein
LSAGSNIGEVSTLAIVDSSEEYPMTVDGLLIDHIFKDEHYPK